MYGKCNKKQVIDRPRYGQKTVSKSPQNPVVSHSFDLGQDVHVRHNGSSQATPDPRSAEYEVPTSGWPSIETVSEMSAYAEYEVPETGWGKTEVLTQSAMSIPSTLPSPPPVLFVHHPESTEPINRKARTSPPPPSQEKTEISEAELISDIQSILKTPERCGQAAKPPQGQPKSQSQVASADPPPNAAFPSPVDQSTSLGLPHRNEHAIFDRIAESMAHAQKYDLGSVALQQRFDDFDRQWDQEATAQKTPPLLRQQDLLKSPSPSDREAATTADFVSDLDLIRQEKSAPLTTEKIPLDPGVGGQSISAEALEPGDIILSTTDISVSTVIRTITDSKVSHCALYIGNHKIVEAMEDGVLLRSLDTALADDSLAVAYRHRDMTPDKAIQMIDYVKTQVRLKRPFDHWGLVRVAPEQLARAICNRLTGKARKLCLDGASYLKVGTDDANSFYCSELVLEALRHVGLGISKVEPSWSSPEQIIELHFNGLLDYVGHLKV